MDYRIFLLLGVSWSIRLFWTYIRNRDNKIIDNELEIKRKQKLKYIIENREVREIKDEFDENQFWEIIESLIKRSRNNYKNHLGLIKDEFRKLNSDELLMVDNLLIRFYKDFFTQDILAASYIIFNSSDIKLAFNLMSFLITKGRTKFKYACLNPELIVDMNIETIIDLNFHDIISELYFLKTEKFLPETGEEDGFNEITGERWTVAELPSKFPKLWMHFA